jgi:hypothetical protein
MAQTGICPELREICSTAFESDAPINKDSPAAAVKIFDTPTVQINR